MPNIVDNFTFIETPIKDVFVIIENDGNQVAKSFKPVLIPSEMTMVKLVSDKLKDIKGELTVRLEKRA